MLTGLTVLDLSWGVAGPVTTMLLADRGATVVKIEPPGGDPFRATPGYVVWNRGKRSVVLDLKTPAGVADLERLALTADVVVESFSPGVSERLGIDESSLRAVNDRLVHCSITGYGRRGSLRDRPGIDGLVQARLGIQNEQPGIAGRSGPVFLHAPLPSMGAALLASIGIRAALVARDRTGRGQAVETSLLQGGLLWTTQMWKRAERPTPPLNALWQFKDFPPTPCFEAGDGRWFHPMPQAVPVAMAHVARDPATLPPGGMGGSYDERKAYFDALRELYLQRPMDEWIDVIRAADVACQPIQPAEAVFDHPQVVHNGAATVVQVPGVGAVTQFGRAFRVRGEDDVFAPSPPPAVGEHTREVLDAGVVASAPAPTSMPAPGVEAGRGPLAGIRVVDFGTFIAGPFATMLLGDLGADVIKVDPIGPDVGGPKDATWVACQRGKRSIVIDLKSEAGQRLAGELIASAQVLHYNLRPGVAERLGFGYERAREINPEIVFCHLTGYGSSGPLESWPGVDQMGQALWGLEHEQGATPNGGHPTWLRTGLCDAAAGALSVVGVLEMLLARPRTAGVVEADILTAAGFLSSDAFLGPDELPRRAHLDRGQTGLGPLYRLYRTAAGWLCIAADRDEHWHALCDVLGLPLAADERYRDAASRALHGPELSDALEPVFLTRTAADWFARLDERGVPCEISSEEGGDRWWDDADAIANGWVARYPHPVWGRLEQPGRFIDFSLTPAHPASAPPVLGADTRAILNELGYDDAAVERLRADGVVAW